MKARLSRRRFIASAAVSIVPSAIAVAQPQKTGLMALLIGETPSTGTHNRTATDWKNAGIIDLTNSPYAKLKTVPVRAVVIEDGFWSQRRKTNLLASIPSMHDELLEHGRMTNFLRLQGKSSQPQRGPLYSDSDIYKWTEAIGFQLQSGDQPELRKTTDTMIHEIVAIQEPGGYLNTYFTGDKKPLRMTYGTQTSGHELYCIGHMLQAAIAYYRATGDPTLLDAGTRFVDDFLIPNYGPSANQKAIVSGHPEIEMALIELSRTTGNPKYVDLAGYILHGDKRIPLKPQQIVYMYCGIPFTSRTKLEGHAVRCMYACCGATDYYLETGDPTYWKTLNVLWNDLTAHQLYVNGGVGARASGEAFGDAYELPNAQAYGESCAAIGNMMWNWRMLSASGDAKFTDVIERALYNGINSGMSLDGKTYCYRNPLAFDPAAESRDGDLTNGKIRNPWYDTTCCPPNLERTFASLSGYFYSTSADGVYVHLYDNCEMNWHLNDGTALKVQQKTNYPWSGDVQLTVSPATPGEFVMYVRIPGWSTKNSVKVNGKEFAGAKPGKYLAIRRRWTENDTIDLSFDMTTHLLKANPAVTEDRGRVAFQRGPIVFCMEHLDQPDHSSEMNLAAYTVQSGGETTTHFQPELLNGVMVLSHPATISKTASDTGLYFSASTPKPPESPTTVRLIPYYAWANRESASMQVWIPYKDA
ncbi:MAG: beta-L-arabinofuranosidase domain-containing protein [Edaphobacter sp.]